MFITMSGNATENAFCGVHSTGAYTGVAVNAIVEVLEERGEFILQKVTTNALVKFRIFWDGECVSTQSSEKEARAMLNDFCPVAKKRGRPKKVLA